MVILQGSVLIHGLTIYNLIVLIIIALLQYLAVHLARLDTSSGIIDSGSLALRAVIGCVEIPQQLPD